MVLLWLGPGATGKRWSEYAPLLEAREIIAQHVWLEEREAVTSRANCINVLDHAITLQSLNLTTIT